MRRVRVDVDARRPDAAALAYLRACPKVELHVHLEGAIRPQRLLAVMRRNGLHPHLRTLDDLMPLFRHDDFAAFLDHFRFVVTCLQQVEDVHDVALDLFRELVAQQVVYAEVIFSAAIFVRAGMPLEALLDAVLRAEATAWREAVPAAAGIAPRYNLVLDVVRNFGPEAARASVAAMVRLGHPRVVGLHLGGDEVRFPARDFAAAYAMAAEAGLGCAVHAGEADGPASIRDAIGLLGARRIGHGIRAVEDADLLQQIATAEVLLEVCPTSNVRTGVVSDLAHHPLPSLLRSGVRVVLGADDPSFFDTTLTGELEQAYTHLGLDLAQLDACAENGLRGAFIPAAERASRLDDLRTRRVAARLAAGLPA